MRLRLTRITVGLATLGSIAFMCVSALNLFVLDFVCYDMCPPEDQLANALAQRLTWYWEHWLPGGLALTLAWILCLVQLGRARHWRTLLIVLLAPFASVGLSALVALWAADGHLLPTTWRAFSDWGARDLLVLPPLLLGPLAIMWACLALERTRPSIAPSR
jgi:hypothetical protein